MADGDGAGRVAELIRTQRAVREYTDQVVGDDEMRAIVNAGRRAQSSKNGQPWYFVIVRDREQLRKLSESGQFAAHVARAAFAVALVEAPSGGAGLFDLGQAAAYLQMEAWDLGVGPRRGLLRDMDALPREGEGGAELARRDGLSHRAGFRLSGAPEPGPAAAQRWPQDLR